MTLRTWQPWLQEIQGRVSPARPFCERSGRRGSAMRARIISTPSACSPARMLCACALSMMRPAANTGMLTRGFDLGGKVRRVAASGVHGGMEREHVRAVDAAHGDGQVVDAPVWRPADARFLCPVLASVRPRARARPRTGARPERDCCPARRPRPRWFPVRNAGGCSSEPPY